MPTIKNVSDSRYTKVSNKMLSDERLDWKDIGMLTYLMSLPPDWKLNRKHLAKIKKTGESGLQTIFTNLQKHGYLLQKRHFGGTVDWIIGDDPDLVNQYEASSPHLENPNRTKPHPENQDVLIKKENHTKETTVQKKHTPPPQIAIPADIDQDLWDEFTACRRRLKASNSETAIKILLTSLDKCVSAGFTRNEAISEAIERGWKSVKPEWLKNSVSGNNGSFAEQRKAKNEEAGQEFLNGGGHVINSTCEIIQ